MSNFERRITLVLVICMVLGACGLSADIHPRDIDPAKQELLTPATTAVTAPTGTNP